VNDLLETIRAAVGEKATAEQKTAGAHACRTLLAALEAQVGKPLPAPAGAPVPHPLANIDATQALDLLLARLRAAIPSNEGAVERPRPANGAGPRIPIVGPPPGVPWKKR
jgi:hypothetical protein